MANVSFDDTELSSYGVSIRGVSARKMAGWKADGVALPARNRQGDTSQEFDVSQTQLTGMLSSDTEVWTNHTHAEMLNRLTALKGLLNPVKGYRKLVITGDDTTRYRWCRYADMDWNEDFPVFRKPFNPIGLTFDNLEPYWRKAVTAVQVSTTPTAIPNAGHADTRPLLTLSVVTPIVAIKQARVQPVTLVQIDDLLVQWKGIATDNGGTLEVGDLIKIDSETLTVTVTRAGSGDTEDVVRYYDYDGPDAYTSDGFPVVKRGGSTVTSVHAALASANFQYEELYL